MKDKQLIKSIELWLNQKGNSTAKLALMLGYKSSSPIQMWIWRGSIPDYQIERVKKIIFKKGSNNE